MKVPLIRRNPRVALSCPCIHHTIGEGVNERQGSYSNATSLKTQSLIFIWSMLCSIWSWLVLLVSKEWLQNICTHAYCRFMSKIVLQWGRGGNCRFNSTEIFFLFLFRLQTRRPCNIARWSRLFSKSKLIYAERKIYRKCLVILNSKVTSGSMLSCFLPLVSLRQKGRWKVAH